MTSIDFLALMREEKAKLRQQSRNIAMPRSDKNTLPTNGSAAVTSSAPLANQQPGETSTSSSSSSSITTRLETHDFTLAPVEPLDISPYRIPGISSVWYIPDYISEDEEASLLQYVHSVDPDRWQVLASSGRRLQRWGGHVTRNGLTEQEALPPWLQACGHRLVQSKIFDREPNHVLLNEYEPGQGIMPHTDGPLYVPFVAILSLQGDTMFQFWESVRDSRFGSPLLSLYVRRRSLLLFSEDAYTKFVHGLEEKESDIITESVANTEAAKVEVGQELPRHTRISFTIRIVLPPKPVSCLTHTDDANSNSNQDTEPY
eukprot:GILK01006751.1.p2 GENE.GILK01006751.1~~GILK01006751.1.p2  ORF type:complete len:316 (-),score=19.71 GILK01006751.1:1189-2136(-)